MRSLETVTLIPSLVADKVMDQVKDGDMVATERHNMITDPLGMDLLGAAEQTAAILALQSQQVELERVRCLDMDSQVPFLTKQVPKQLKDKAQILESPKRVVGSQLTPVISLEPVSLEVRDTAVGTQQ